MSSLCSVFREFPCFKEATPLRISAPSELPGLRVASIEVLYERIPAACTSAVNLSAQ